MFQSSWIHEVIMHRCSVHDVPLGQHLLLPHYLAPREPGSPQPTSLRPTALASHPSEANNENKWKTSRESQHQCHHQGKKLKPCSSTCVKWDSASLATQSGGNDNNRNGGYSLSESASVMFAEYNATWDKLESRLKSIDLKGML